MYILIKGIFNVTTFYITSCLFHPLQKDQWLQLLFDQIEC